MIKVGDRFESNKGGWGTVISVEDSANIIVEFEDENKFQLQTSSEQLRDGTFKNPFAPRVFGIGYMGVGKHVSKKVSNGIHEKSYQAWHGMLSRCYSGDNLFPQYKGVVVNSVWHNYQNFAEWYCNELKFTGWAGANQLDKDVLTDNNTYSPENCCLIPAVINTAICKAKPSSKLTGVLPKFSGYYKVVRGLDISHLRFETELEAHLAYIEAKQRKVKELAELFKEYLNPKVYTALKTRDYRKRFTRLELNFNN